MRRFRSLVRSATLEALAEPLSAVLFLVALIAVPLLPAFHCHQFGEAGRLPRECGFSALLVFGIVFATASAVRVIGGEISSGTAAAALARDVSRPLFFCAKVIGVLVAFALFSVAVGFSTVTSVATAEMGEVQERLGYAHIWLPGLVSMVVLTLAGFALAAVLNRFFRMRFCVTACLSVSGAQAIALALVAALAKVPMQWSLLPALAALAAGCGVFVVLAGALAVRLPPAAVTTGISLAALSSFVWPVRAILPDIQMFWLVDSYSYGGVPAVGQLVSAFAVGALLSAFWLAVGSILLERREIP